MAADLSNVVLVCPNNDTESHLILALAAHLNLCVIQSDQPHGAKLDREPHLISKIKTINPDEVWIVEIPGPSVESALRYFGFSVKIIDHHTYGSLDRAHDESGTLLPSSLEQFLALTQISDQELSEWGFDPVVVRGIGIMDACFVQGLRDADYSLDEIRRVLEYGRENARGSFDRFDEAEAEALRVWNERKQQDGFWILQSHHELPLRGPISYRMIYEGCDTDPFILQHRCGNKIAVQNVSPELATHLLRHFSDALPYAFGTKRNVGIDNTKRGTNYTIEDVLTAIRQWRESQ